MYMDVHVILVESCLLYLGQIIKSSSVVNADFNKIVHSVNINYKVKHKLLFHEIVSIMMSVAELTYRPRY